MKKLRLAFGGMAVASAVAFWVGCGSTTDDSLTNSGTDGGAEATTTPPPTPPPAPPPPPPSDAGDAGDADLPDGTVVADGGNTLQDSGPGGSTSALPCGAATCSIPSQTCCVGGGGGGGRTLLCVVGPSSNCPVPDAGPGNQPEVLALKCSSNQNCAAGQECCANVTDAGVVQSSCVTTGTCAGTGAIGNNQHAVLCTPDSGAAPSGCDAGVNCLPPNDWGLPQTFGVCGNAGGPF